MIDTETLKRLTNLAFVGNFLFETSNETSEQMDYFLAKSSLKEFDNNLKMLELDGKTMDGLNKLVQYLDKKIEKRQRQASGEFSPD